MRLAGKIFLFHSKTEAYNKSVPKSITKPVLFERKQIDKKYDFKLW